jgi:hypothetical protein
MSVIAMALSVTAVSAAPGVGTTVGDFALRISLALGQKPADVAAAVRALEKGGVDVGQDVGAKLTWARAAGILQGLGVKVTAPSDPAGLISMARAAQIASVVAMFRAEHHGHHHGDGCPPSPSSPGDCDDDDDDQGGDHDGDQGGDHDGHHGDDGGHDHDGQDGDEDGD